MKTYTHKQIENLAAEYGGRFFGDDVALHVGFENGLIVKFLDENGEGLFVAAGISGTHEQTLEHAAFFAALDAMEGDEKIDWLTVERANELRGKRIVCRYDDVNHGVEKFFIAGMMKTKSNSIGQTEEWRLLTQDIRDDGSLVDHKRRAFFKNGKLFEPNNRQYIIDGKFIEFQKSAKVEDLKRLYKTDNVIYIYDAKTGDCPEIEVHSEPTATYYYEWAGIFRRGSGAERLQVVKVLE